MKKLYWSISEVSKMLDEEMHIIRYWEKEFTMLDPKKGKSGNRRYREYDVRRLKIIKYLLREMNMPIKEAVRFMNKNENRGISLEKLKKKFEMEKSQNGKSSKETITLLELKNIRDILKKTIKILRS